MYLICVTVNVCSKEMDIYEFKVCKSVHHCKIQKDRQPDATIF